MEAWVPPATVVDGPDPAIHPEIERPILVVDALSLWYGRARALTSISMAIPEKKITAFIGPSGCGKSTLLRCFNRMNDLIDDVRIGVAGRVPVTFIGGVSTDHSGFGVGRLLDVEVISERILALHEGRDIPIVPGYDEHGFAPEDLGL